MTTPRRFYRDGESDVDARAALPARLATSLLTLGVFVSLTTAGRLAPAHLVGTALAWAFLPALQLAALAAALRAGGSRAPLAPAFSRYLAGHGPWFLWLLSLAGVCLVAPDAWRAFRALLSTGALPLSLVATLAWGAVIQAALLSAACATRARAALATAVFYVTLGGSIALWYVATGSLLPVLGLVS